MYISLFVESLNHGKQNCAWVYIVTSPQSLYFTSDTYSQGLKKKKKKQTIKYLPSTHWKLRNFDRLF